MPVKEYDPSSLLASKQPGSSTPPSTNSSRRVMESFSSLLDNLKYCRAKQEFHHSLVPLKELRRRSDGWPRHSSSSSSSSSSREEHKLAKEFKSNRQRRRSSSETEQFKLLQRDHIFPEHARLSHSTDESEEGVPDLQPLVDELMSSSNTTERRRHAAERVRRLAKSSTRVSMTLVKLGVISPLISMLDTDAFHLSSLLALLSLAVGTNVNKAAIVTAGAVPKMVSISQDAGTSVQECLAAVFLSLSALDVNKPVIGNSGAVKALISILKQGSLKAKKDALKALYNLSIFHGNVKVIVDANLIQSLLDMIYHPELVEIAVDLLGNLAATEAGRKAIVDKQDAVLILVDVLGWADAPECQEKAVSVLMTMAHRSRALRQVIARCGAVSSLLELSLLGSTIAQKVSAWILDCLRQDEDLNRSSTRCSSSASAAFYDVYEEAAHPGKFVHKVLQQRNMMSREEQRGPNHDISDHFISITL